MATLIKDGVSPFGICRMALVRPIIDDANIRLTRSSPKDSTPPLGPALPCLDARREEGRELDLDVAIRSLIDFKGGAQPDPRINMSHRTAGRDIAVTLLLDLSESLNEKVKSSEQTILELSQEAVSLLAWAIERLGDPLAIADFHSNTRHDVRYQHLKGFLEPWNDEAAAWRPWRRASPPAWAPPCAMLGTTSEAPRRQEAAAGLDRRPVGRHRRHR